jgi:hypothetical protein
MRHDFSSMLPKSLSKSASDSAGCIVPAQSPHTPLQAQDSFDRGLRGLSGYQTKTTDECANLGPATGPSLAHSLFEGSRGPIFIVNWIRSQRIEPTRRRQGYGGQASPGSAGRSLP